MNMMARPEGTFVIAWSQTEVEGLYVCDASVIPESPGVPLVLILVSLAKWFSKRLLAS